MSFVFAKGKAYYANPVLTGGRQKIVACNGRRGRYATFSRVDLLKRVEVGDVDGREIARIRGTDGMEYFVSAAAEVDLEHVSAVIEAMK